MRTLSFTNSQGRKNKGVLFEAQGESVSSLGFIYLPGSVLGTVAVHRLGIEIAHLLAEAGHPVYLFDHAGIGESEGEHPAGTHEELTAWVGSGSLVPDTLSAVDVLQKHTGSSRTALIGHCGGAVTSAYAGARHPSVRGLFLMSLPTRLDPEGTSELDNPHVAEEYLTLYRERLFSPNAWLRLFRGRSDYKTLARILGNKVKGKLRPSEPPAEVPPISAFNPRLIADIERSITDGKTVSVVFGDRDPDFHHFEQFRAKHLPPSVKVRVLKDTSHGYVTEASQSLLFREISRFAQGLSGPMNGRG